MSKVNFAEKLSKFSEQWTPKVIAEMNDYQFKLVKIEGEFVWHDHHDTCLLYTSPSPRDRQKSRMPSSA